MAISFKKYIDITSGVGGGASVRDRDLILRVFSSNIYLPPHEVVEMESLDDVKNYFPSGSSEIDLASFYFGWVSKQTRKAKKISFARYVESDSQPYIFGNKTVKKLSDFTSITDGQLTVTLNSAQTLTGINFSTATSLSDVADIVKEAINSKIGSLWTEANVIYDAGANQFILVGGDVGDYKVGASGDVANLLGWVTGATYADGALKETALDALSNSADVSNNFASFVFLSTLDENDITDIASWNNTQNVMYAFILPVEAYEAESYSKALIGIGGTTLELKGTTGQYSYIIPAIIAAATDYSKVNSSQNYMYQQFPSITPNVTTTAMSNTYDSLRVNYYGQTQTAGQNISFYQRGLMMGGATDLVDQNIYFNEVWLKDTIATRIMTLFLTLAKIPANDKGRSQLLAVIQGRINQALENGVISIGKSLTEEQKLYIAEITGDDTAYTQIENIGYWVDCEMQTSTTTDGRTEYKAVYTLIYSKDDAVRKVEGTHTLI